MWLSPLPLRICHTRRFRRPASPARWSRRRRAAAASLVLVAAVRRRGVVRPLATTLVTNAATHAVVGLANYRRRLCRRRGASRGAASGGASRRGERRHEQGGLQVLRGGAERRGIVLTWNGRTRQGQYVVTAEGGFAATGCTTSSHQRERRRGEATGDDAVAIDTAAGQHSSTVAAVRHANARVTNITTITTTAATATSVTAAAADVPRRHR
mmetsp:Transcript_2239/g.5196  ORF Transcript_2239/g.5196 Transcript_2239/m.5196 type:complete len:212 (-) Transcript_2239:361-996(-)